MKKIVCSVALSVLVLAGSGCATSSCSSGGTCGSGGLFSGHYLQRGMNLFQGQPVRSLFRGAPCSTCNPPAGQPANCDSNVAPLCQDGNCGSHAGLINSQAPVYGDQGVPYYGEPTLNAPQPAIAPEGQFYNAPVQGSSSRVPYGNSDDIMGGLPMIDSFGSGIDADTLPPSL